MCIFTVPWPWRLLRVEDVGQSISSPDRETILFRLQEFIVILTGTWTFRLVENGIYFEAFSADPKCLSLFGALAEIRRFVVFIGGRAVVLGAYSSFVAEPDSCSPLCHN